MEWIDMDILRADFIPKSHDPYVTDIWDDITGEKRKIKYKYITSDQTIPSAKLYADELKKALKVETDKIIYSDCYDNNQRASSKYFFNYNSKKEKEEMMNNPTDTLYRIQCDYDKKKRVENDIAESNSIAAGMKERAGELIKEKQEYNSFALGALLTYLIKDVKIDWRNNTVIVFWEDGVKTHVHCMNGDEFDPEYGIMRCVFKRALGSGCEVKRFFKKYIPENTAKVIVEEDNWPEDTEKEIDGSGVEDYVTEELEKRLAKVNY